MTPVPKTTSKKSEGAGVFRKWECTNDSDENGGRSCDRGPLDFLTLERRIVDSVSAVRPNPEEGESGEKPREGSPSHEPRQTINLKTLTMWAVAS